MKSFPKPGAKSKTTKIKNRSPRLHNLTPPKNKYCRHCGVEKGTECFRHTESRIIKFLDSGGIMGGKINDNLTAWLCLECDFELSYKLDKNSSWQQERSHALLWAIAIIKTHLLD